MTLLGGREVRRLVETADVVPSRHRGQNFLCDPNVVRRIVDVAGIVAGESVLEIGVGVGSLTAGLVDAGALVVGIEVDERLAAVASSALPAESATLVVADAAALDWPPLLDSHHVTKMVSNLPYSVGTTILVDLLDSASEITTFVVMVQREVGERLVASPGTDAYGAVSVRVAYHCEARLAGRVPPTVFWPRPEVDSVLVRLDRRPEEPVTVARDRLFAVVSAGFAQRRKTMRRALASGWPQDVVDSVLAECRVDPRARAETLGIDTFAALAEALP